LRCTDILRSARLYFFGFFFRLFGRQARPHSRSINHLPVGHKPYNAIHNKDHLSPGPSQDHPIRGP
jgi:hypothetical protein